MSEPIIEQRTVCNECGQAIGLFHKRCGGRWVRQRRTVTPWRTIGAPPKELSDEPTEGLRRLVERMRREAE